MVVAAKVSIFSETNALSVDFFIFHSKREAIAHGREASNPVFPLWVPNCHSWRWQFGSFFAQIPRSPTIKCRIYRRFRGVGREKSAPLLADQPPPPYAPEAIALFVRAVYVRNFYLWQLPSCVAADHVSPTTSAVVAYHKTRKAPMLTHQGFTCSFKLHLYKVNRC